VRASRRDASECDSLIDEYSCIGSMFPVLSLLAGGR
jgi:hypothetical protein